MCFCIRFQIQCQGGCYRSPRVLCRSETSRTEERLRADFLPRVPAFPVAGRRVGGDAVLDGAHEDDRADTGADRLVPGRRGRAAAVVEPSGGCGGRAGSAAREAGHQAAACPTSCSAGEEMDSSR